MERIWSDSDVRRRFISIKGDHDFSIDRWNGICRNGRFQAATRSKSHRYLTAALRDFVVSIEFFLTGIIKRL